MAAPGKVRSGVGFRHLQMFALNAAGYPDATSTTVYEGRQVSGARALTIEDPEPRDIIHIGDDRVFQRDILPPDSPVSGELTVGKIDDDTEALARADLAFVVGEANFFGVGSANKGEEYQLGILAFRQTLDTDPTSSDFGARRWEGRLFPKVFLVPREAGFEDTPEAKMYSFRPLFVSAHLWGTSFASGTEGFTEAQGLRLVSEYKPWIVAFKADNAETDFLFHADRPAQAVGKVVVWVTGVEQTDGFTVYLTGVDFSAAPITDAIIVVFYERT